MKNYQINSIAPIAAHARTRAATPLESIDNKCAKSNNLRDQPGVEASAISCHAANLTTDKSVAVTTSAPNKTLFVAHQHDRSKNS